MKSFIIISIIIFSQNIYAERCYKELCINDIVRDQFGWRGTIVGFDIDLDEVIVGLSHTPSTYQFPYEELGKNVLCYKGFCQSGQAIDASGRKVDIIEVFTNGLIYVFDENIDGFLLYNIKELSVDLDHLRHL